MNLLLGVLALQGARAAVASAAAFGTSVCDPEFPGNSTRCTLHCEREGGDDGALCAFPVPCINDCTCAGSGGCDMGDCIKDCYCPGGGCRMDICFGGSCVNGDGGGEGGGDLVLSFDDEEIPTPDGGGGDLVLSFNDDPPAWSTTTTSCDAGLVGAPCDEEGQRCASGSETCCGETYDSFVCECAPSWDGSGALEYQCYNTDACFIPDCDGRGPSSTTTTTAAAATAASIPVDEPSASSASCKASLPNVRCGPVGEPSTSYIDLLVATNSSDTFEAEVTFDWGSYQYTSFETLPTGEWVKLNSTHVYTQPGTYTTGVTVRWGAGSDFCGENNLTTENSAPLTIGEGACVYGESELPQPTDAPTLRPTFPAFSGAGIRGVHLLAALSVLAVPLLASHL